MVKSTMTLAERNNLQMELRFGKPSQRRKQEILELLQRDEERSRILDLRDEWEDEGF
jgi:hypothetical protein